MVNKFNKSSMAMPKESTGQAGFDPFANLSPEQQTMLLLMQSGLNYDDATSFLGGAGGYQNEDIQYLVSLGMSPQEAQAYLLNKELGGGRSGGSAPAPVHWQSQIDPRTGEVIFFNPVTRAFERSGIQMGFPGIDPREEAAEEARQGANSEQLQLAGLQDNAAMTRATLQQQGILSNADMMEGARQADNAARLRAFEARQQNLPAFGNIALGAAEQMRETLRSGGDYLARAFGQAGQNSPFGLVTPADQINSLLSAQEQIENEFNRQYSPQGEARQAILPLLPQFQAPNLTQFQGYSTPESTLGGMPMAGGGGAAAGGGGGGGTGFALSPGVNKNANRPGVKGGTLGTKPQPNVKDADKQSPKGLVGGLTPAEQIAMLSNAGPGRTGGAIRSTPRFQSDTIGPRRSSGEPNLWDKIGELFGDMMPQPRYLNSPGYERGTAPGFTTAPMFVAGEPAPGRIGETGELLINPTEAPIAVVANKNLPRNMKVVPGYAEGTKSMGKSRLSPEEQRRMVGSAGSLGSAKATAGFAPQPIIPGGQIGPRVGGDTTYQDDPLSRLLHYGDLSALPAAVFNAGPDILGDGASVGMIDDIGRSLDDIIREAVPLVANRLSMAKGQADEVFQTIERVKQDPEELLTQLERVRADAAANYAPPITTTNKGGTITDYRGTETALTDFDRATRNIVELKQALGKELTAADRREIERLGVQDRGREMIQGQNNAAFRMQQLTEALEDRVSGTGSQYSPREVEELAAELRLTPEDLTSMEMEIRGVQSGRAAMSDDQLMDMYMRDWLVDAGIVGEETVRTISQTRIRQLVNKEYDGGTEGFIRDAYVGMPEDGPTYQPEGYDEMTRSIVGFANGTIFDQGYKDDLNTATNGPDYSNNRSVFDFMTQYGIKELEDTTTGNQYGRSGNTLTRANPNANSAFNQSTSPFINRYDTNSGGDGGGDVDLFNTNRVSQQDLIKAAWKGMPPRIRQIFSGKAPTPGNVTFGLPAGFKAPTMRMLAGLQPDEADAMRTAVNVISSGRASIDDLVNNAKQSAAPLGAGFRGVNLVGGRF